MQARYGKGEKECSAILAKIPIIHLHGRLGYLPWQQKDDARDYTPDINAEVLRLCVKNIKVVHEDHGDADFALARQLLSDADRVYCLGFGYGSVNTDRLNIKSLRTNLINGTGVGLSKKECNDIRSGRGGVIEVCHEMDCLKLLREVADFS